MQLTVNLTFDTATPVEVRDTKPGMVFADKYGCVWVRLVPPYRGYSQHNAGRLACRCLLDANGYPPHPDSPSAKGYAGLVGGQVVYLAK